MGDKLKMFLILKTMFLHIAKIIENFFMSYKFNSQTPVLLQGTALGLLTVFIPLSIFILESEREFKDLDKFVILGKIINPGIFVGGIILSFVSPLLWHEEMVLFNYIVIISSLVGDSLLLYLLKRLYSWIKRDKFEYRYSYLKTLNNAKDGILETCWRSVWKNDLEEIYERKFIEIFVEKIEHFIAGKQYDSAYYIIKIFSDEIEKRNIFVVITLGLKSFIKIHYGIWQLIRQGKRKSNKKIDLSNIPPQLYPYLIEVLKKLRDLSLKDKGDGLYSGDWWNSYCTEFETLFKEDIKDEEYTSELLDLIFKDFFEKFEENPHDIDIPKEWKVTINNLKNSNIKARTIWECFKKWAWNKINRPRLNNDFSLDYCLPMIFCEGQHTSCKLDLMALWEFISIGLYLEKRVPLRDIIKSLWPYPTSGFTDIFYNPIPEEERIKKSAQLASELFGNIFQTSKLEEHLKQLEKIPPEDRNKNYTIVVTTIKNLLKFIEKT